MVAVRYIVHNVDSAVAFYRDHFGFKLEQQFGASPDLGGVMEQGRAGRFVFGVGHG